MPLIVSFIVIGSLGGAAAWILGSARGLSIASKDNSFPSVLTRVNKHNMPVGTLLAQGVLVSVLCVIFFIMSTLNSSYWLLSNLTAQLALLYYILIFAAGIRLRYKHSKVERAYKIPGGLLGMWLVGGVGIVTCFSAIVFGFLPPTQVAETNKIIRYELILFLGMAVACIFPLIANFLIKFRQIEAALTLCFW